MKNKLDFNILVNTIENINKEFTVQAKQAVNISLTLRNWFIGLYINEYELNGSDRAKYGDKLFLNLSKKLKKISNCNKRQLYRYKRFYNFYPQIVGTVSPQFKKFIPEIIEIKKKGTALPKFNLPVEKLLSHLSYSHFDLLVDEDNKLKRAFYEIECFTGNWSVRELRRQISSLYYERSGLSDNKIKIAELVKKNSEKATLQLEIRDPYVFEFLGLKSKEVMSESHLESELLDKIEEFLLELGNGFCFEARQKRILIGDKHNFIDLVFYHRILKCHVLIDLKVKEFNHENIGQLNTYVSWYKKNMMSEGDNLPIGILMCSKKDNALVEYALAGMNKNLFVSKYQLELPKLEEMKKIIENKS